MTLFDRPNSLRLTLLAMTSLVVAAVVARFVEITPRGVAALSRNKHPGPVSEGHEDSAPVPPEVEGDLATGGGARRMHLEEFLQRSSKQDLLELLLPLADSDVDVDRVLIARWSSRLSVSLGAIDVVEQTSAAEVEAAVSLIRRVQRSGLTGVVLAIGALTDTQRRVRDAACDELRELDSSVADELSSVCLNVVLGGTALAVALRCELIRTVIESESSTEDRGEFVLRYLRGSSRSEKLAALRALAARSSASNARLGDTLRELAEGKDRLLAALACGALLGIDGSEDHWISILSGIAVVDRGFAFDASVPILIGRLGRSRLAEKSVMQLLGMEDRLAVIGDDAPDEVRWVVVVEIVRQAVLLPQGQVARLEPVLGEPSWFAASVARSLLCRGRDCGRYGLGTSFRELPTAVKRLAMREAIDCDDPEFVSAVESAMEDPSLSTQAALYLVGPTPNRRAAVARTLERNDLQSLGILRALASRSRSEIAEFAVQLRKLVASSDSSELRRLAATLLARVHE